MQVLRDRGGIRIGRTGSSEEINLEKLGAHTLAKRGYSLVAVPLGEEEIDGYYHGCSNEILWPLFHDFATRCNFDPTF